MPFSFNFKVEETDGLAGEGGNKVDNVNGIGQDDVIQEVAKDWFPAEEIFLSERHHAKGGGYDAQFRIPKYWADSLELDSWYNPSLLQPHSIDCCEWRAMINQQECFSGQLIFFLVLPPKLIEFLLIPT